VSVQIEVFRWCQQNEYFQQLTVGSKGDTYYTTYSTMNSGKYGANWHCTCPGFKYRGTCKHVTKATDDKCDYGWEAASGSPVSDWPNGKCPKCGSKAVGVKVAV